MKKLSQPDKTISKENLNRLARQWVELVLGQLQYQKYMDEQKQPVPVEEKQLRI